MLDADLERLITPERFSPDVSLAGLNLGSAQVALIAFPSHLDDAVILRMESKTNPVVHAYLSLLSSSSAANIATTFILHSENMFTHHAHASSRQSRL
jgi:hypothetical protein